MPTADVSVPAWDILASNGQTIEIVQRWYDTDADAPLDLSGHTVRIWLGGSAYPDVDDLTGATEVIPTVTGADAAFSWNAGTTRQVLRTTFDGVVVTLGKVFPSAVGRPANAGGAAFLVGSPVVCAVNVSAGSAGGGASGPAGGVLAGTYPDPTFAADMATQAELDAVASAKADTTAVVLKADYNANTILAATTDDTPAALTIAASRIVGRKASGNIAAMTGAETTDLLRAASTTATGVAELATSAETGTGTDTGRTVTPAGGAATYARVYVHNGTNYVIAGGRIFAGPEDPTADGFTMVDGDFWDDPS